MFKNLLKITLGIIISLTFVSVVHAAGVSIRLSSPKSPANQNNFDVNFVTLDTAGNAITVKCFKKGPGDGGFSQFGSDVNLAAGGNAGNCSVTGSVVNTTGSYQFQATAYNGSETVTSNTVSVDYNTGGPDTPTNYSKEKPSSCTYRIKFITANDGGKTVKVEVYRSENTNFNADSGSRVATVSIGSNTSGSADVSVADCNKEYFFAVRAFDSAGNGSGLAGDSKTITTTTTTTTGATSPVSAIVVPGGGTGGSVLGEKKQGTESGEVKGESTGEAGVSSPSPSSEPTGKGGLGTLLSARNIIIALAFLALIALGYMAFKGRQKAE